MAALDISLLADYKDVLKQRMNEAKLVGDKYGEKQLEQAINQAIFDMARKAPAGMQLLDITQDITSFSGVKYREGSLPSNFLTFNSSSLMYRATDGGEDLRMFMVRTRAAFQQHLSNQFFAGEKVFIIEGGLLITSLLIADNLFSIEFPFRKRPTSLTTVPIVNEFAAGMYEISMDYTTYKLLTSSKATETDQKLAPTYLNNYHKELGYVVPESK